ncbi:MULTISPECIES: copper resistance CopC family protein [Planococcus]|uniref:copper resistance CopC family protein n=1 Tax=Planococcus TaxID=1372 RepID=UPI00163DDFC0|nr:copper resistance CopC family protein [Planococcus soli]
MKKTALFFLFFLLLSSPAVFAHTTLESANPAEGDVVTEELQEMVLEFNTDLEQGSSFTVEDGSGQEVPISVEMGEQSMTGTLGAAIANGTYTVNWKIIGADGHPIEGTYAFTLEISDDSSSSETTEEAVPTTEDESADQGGTEESQNENLAASQEATNAPYVMVIVLMVLAVIAVGTLMWVSNRRGS